MPVAVGRIRLRQALVLLTGAAVGAESAHLAFQTNWYAFGGTSWWSALLGLSAGAAVVATGVVELGSQRNRTAGALLAAAGITWMVTVWDDPAAPAWIFLAGRMLGTVWPVLVAHSLVRRFGGLSRGERATLALAYAMTVGVDGLAEALVFNPATNGCADCPANPLLLVDAPGAAAGLQQAATLAGPIWTVLLIAALAIRLVRSTSAGRRLELPITAVGMTLLALVAAGYVRAVARRLPETDNAALWAAEAGFAADALSRRRLASNRAYADPAPSGTPGRAGVSRATDRRARAGDRHGAAGPDGPLALSPKRYDTGRHDGTRADRPRRREGGAAC